MRAKVYAHSAIHYDFAIEVLFDDLGGFNIVESNDDSSEGFKRTPAVDWDMFVNCLPKRLEVFGSEDGNIVEILW
jgi:hypothetical protein